MYAPVDVFFLTMAWAGLQFLGCKNLFFLNQTERHEFQFSNKNAYFVGIRWKKT